MKVQNYINKYLKYNSNNDEMLIHIVDLFTGRAVQSIFIDHLLPNPYL